jgi:PIN domain nuclease of toxin-antitoxin system
VILYLDTQVMVWLCEGLIDRLSPSAAVAIEESELVISPMVLLELEYLSEIKRIVKSPLAILNQLQTQIGLKISDHSFEAIIHTSLFETWTRDPFDRVIVAHARTDGHAPLVTSDSKIRENYRKAVW